MSELRDRIVAVFEALWAEDHDTPAPVLADGTPLAETGLDSMGFAVLVAQLDDRLGFDPFTLDSEASYPVTFGQLVAFYEAHEPVA